MLIAYKMSVWQIGGLMVFSLVMMLALTVVALAIWLGDPELVWYQFMVVVGLAFAAAQWLAIRWIDRNGTWADGE